METAWDTAVSTEGKGHFRPDIEGMRAVAILAVLLFHTGLPGAGGGFIGVDVFYVISGFLITGLLLRELTATGRIDLPGFYARRARRLLPAALVVIGVTVAAAWLILPAIDFPAVAGDGAAAALYVSNYRFALSATDYFAADVPPSPLLHYWSLGVEEQFYIFWPLLTLAGSRLFGLRRLWLLMAAVAVGSFALSVVITSLEPPWAFYSLPTRAWQLAIGALIALGVLSLPARFGDRLATLAAGGGIALIAAGVVLIDARSAYPGVLALIPTAGAALLIVAGERSTAVSSRLLASPPMRWIGRISYSLYLWHWPLLILVPLALGNDELWLTAALAVLAIAIADLSTRLIEQPFRAGRLSSQGARRTLVFAGTASLGVAVVALLGAGNPFSAPAPVKVAAPVAVGADGRPLLPPAVLRGPVPADLTPPLTRARDDVARSLADGCQVAYLGVEPRRCAYGVADGPTTVYLIGDSHGAQWLPALEAIAPARGWRIVPQTKGNCPPVDTIVWLERYERPYPECDQWRLNVLEEIAAVRPEIVFVAFSRNQQTVDQAGRHHPISDDLDGWRDALARVLAELRQSAETVVLLADTPRHDRDPVRCLATHRLVEECPAPRGDVLSQSYARLEQEAAGLAGAQLISANEWLCSATECPLIFGDYLVYRDTNHLTATFSAALGEALGWALDHATADDQGGM
jgi:peptidoglycan/LPS O-acetylase OafA/YrhL